MQSTGQTSTQALSLTSMHGSTITYVMVISPSSAPPLSSGVDDSVPRVCEPTASEPAQGRGLQLTDPLPGQPEDRPDLIQRLWRLHAEPAANDLRLLWLQGRQGALHPRRQFLSLGFVQRRESLDGMKRLAS